MRVFHVTNIDMEMYFPLCVEPDKESNRDWKNRENLRSGFFIGSFLEPI